MTIIIDQESLKLSVGMAFYHYENVRKSSKDPDVFGDRMLAIATQYYVNIEPAFDPDNEEHKAVFKKEYTKQLEKIWEKIEKKSTKKK